jgi:hypothetical protein
VQHLVFTHIQCIFYKKICWILYFSFFFMNLLRPPINWPLCRERNAALAFVTGSYINYPNFLILRVSQTNIKVKLNPKDRGRRKKGSMRFYYGWWQRHMWTFLGSNFFFLSKVNSSWLYYRIGRLDLPCFYILDSTKNNFKKHTHFKTIQCLCSFIHKTI